MGGGSSSSETRPGYIYMPEEMTAGPENQMAWLGSLMGMPTGQQWVSAPHEGGGKGGSSEFEPRGRGGRRGSISSGLGGGKGGSRGSWEPTYTNPEDTWFNPFDVPGLTEGQQASYDWARNYTPTDYGAGDELARTLSGGYLYGSNGLESRMKDLTGPLMREWNTSIVPSLQDEATRAGGLASSTYPGLVGKASADLGQRMSEVYAQEWGNERDRMLAALGMAPETGMMDINQMNSLQDILGLPRGVEEEGYTAKWKVAEMMQQLLSAALSGPSGGSSSGWDFSIF